MLRADEYIEFSLSFDWFFIEISMGMGGFAGRRLRLDFYIGG
jgi:hypothetical protein